jgi:hypothetical protein
MFLAMGAAAAGFLLWWRSPMDALNAEMAERVVTSRAALEELAPRRRMRAFSRESY